MNIEDMTWLTDEEGDLFGRRVQAWLATHRVPHAALAAAIGTNQSGLSRTLNSRRAFPVDMALMICGYTGIQLRGTIVVFNPKKAQDLPVSLLGVTGHEPQHRLLRTSSRATHLPPGPDRDTLKSHIETIFTYFIHRMYSRGLPHGRTKQRPAPRRPTSRPRRNQGPKEWPPHPRTPAAPGQPPQRGARSAPNAQATQRPGPATARRAGHQPQDASPPQAPHPRDHHQPSRASTTPASAPGTLAARPGPRAHRTT
jgi:hypothetical protein